jgi:hypothetical protein
MSKSPVFGRGENGRALRKDGTERKARVVLSPAERLLKAQEDRLAAYASVGKNVFAEVKGLENFVSGIGIFRRWHREARAYATEDARNARREYFQRQLEMIEEKGTRAENWLPSAENAAGIISDLYSKIGKDVESFVTDNKRMPNDAEITAIVSKYLTEDVKEVVEGANDPDNDVFAGLRAGDDNEQAS